MKFGTIGSGIIVEAFIKAVQAVPGNSIEAVYSRDKKSERIAWLQNEYAIKAAYDDLDEMFADPVIDFIYVASPNSLHYEQSLKALKAGKNVVCEKPFTSTAGEAKELLATAKANKLMIFEGIVTIHMPNFQLIKDHIQAIGPLKIVQLNYSQYSRKYDLYLAGKNPNVFNPTFSGGCLQDINIYNIHFMLGLFGTAQQTVYYPNLQENGIDTSGVVIMQYPGFVASLVGSKDTKSEAFVLIQGEKGTIHVKGGSNGCSEIVVTLGNKPPKSLNAQMEDNRLYYEVLAFDDIVNKGDYNKCYELAEYSISVVDMVEKARLAAGVVFAADK